MRSLEVAQRAGISYRQIDFWIRRGYIRCHRGQGPGRQREISMEEAAVVETAGQLLKLGIVPERAVRYAREMSEGDTQSIQVGEWELTRLAPAGETR